LDISADNKVQGTVVADNPATLNLLLKDVRSLERALQEAGLRADPGSLQFSLGNQGNASGQTANDPGSGESSGPNTSFNVGEPSFDGSAGMDETWVLTPGRVNFKV
jgi:flagellar hook-length control protein FliK